MTMILGKVKISQQLATTAVDVTFVWRWRKNCTTDKQVKNKGKERKEDNFW